MPATTHLELLATPGHLRSGARLERLPRAPRGLLGAREATPASCAGIGRDLGQPLLRHRPPRPRASSSSAGESVVAPRRPARASRRRRLAVRRVAVDRPRPPRPGVAGPGQRDAGLGRGRPRQLGCGRRPRPPGAAPLRPRRRSPRLCPSAPASPLAANRSPSGVTTTRSGAVEGQVDGLAPNRRRATARPTSESRTDSSDRAAPRRARTWLRTGSRVPAAAPAAEAVPAAVEAEAGGAGLPWASTAPVTPSRAGRPDAACAARRPSTTTAATPRARRGLEGRPPSPRRSRPGRRATPPLRRPRAATRGRPRPAAPTAHGPAPRPGPPSGGAPARRRPPPTSASSVPCGDRLQLGACTRRDRPRAPAGPHPSRPTPRSSRSARRRRPATRCSSEPTGNERIEVLLLAPAERAISSAPGGTRASAWSGSSSPRTADHRSRSGPHLRCRASLAPPSSSVALGRQRRGLLGLGRRQLGGQPGRLGLEGRDHVDVGGGVERRPQRAPTLARAPRQCPGPAPPVPCTRPSAAARSSSRREDSSAAAAAAAWRRARPASPAARAPRRAARPGRRRRAVPPLGQLGQLRRRPGAGGRPAARRPGRRGSGGGRLALERADLAAHLAHQVAESLEVLLGGGQPALGPLAAPAVLAAPRPPPR